MSVTLNGSNGITFNDGSSQTSAASPFGLKNRIINGAMVVDQRNAGAAVTTPDVYTVDRWIQYQGGGGVISWQQSSTAPTGFNNSLSATVTTADTSLGTSDYYFLRQFIEGYNVADLDFGTANAKTVTLSFWVRSSLTGTFGGCLQNGGTNRFYPFTYTISAANTWEQKTVTISGDTSGTWLKTNGAGLGVVFALGFGTSFIGTANAWTSSSFYTATGATNLISTNGATFYITGVQLEVGSTATPFERRLYNQELANCQRYYYRATNTGRLNMGLSVNTTNADGTLPFPTTMRTAPTALEQSGTASHYSVYTAAAANSCTSVPVFIEANIYSGCYRLPTGAAQTTGQSVLMGITNASGYLGWSAEL
jgi:hypothetical protein